MPATTGGQYQDDCAKKTNCEAVPDETPSPKPLQKKKAAKEIDNIDKEQIKSSTA